MCCLILLKYVILIHLETSCRLKVPITASKDYCFLNEENFHSSSTEGQKENIVM